jgi:hypothetical protein
MLLEMLYATLMKNLMLALFLLASIVAAEEPKTLELELGKPFLLSVLTYSDQFGASSLWSDTGVFEDLKFTISSIEDSRCPKSEGDVAVGCMREGEVKVTVSLEGGDNFLLVTPPTETEQNSVVFDSYKLTLIDVTPFPTIEEPVYLKKTVHLLLEKTRE